MRCSQNRCARTATTYKNTAGVVFFVPIQNTTGVPEPPLPILLLRGMEYEETRLVTLEARRTRADIIEVFKITKGLEGLNRVFFLDGSR